MKIKPKVPLFRVPPCISLAETAYLLQLGQLQSVVIFGAKLHEPHVGRLRQLRNDVGVRKHPYKFHKSIDLTAICN